MPSRCTEYPFLVDVGVTKNRKKRTVVTVPSTCSEGKLEQLNVSKSAIAFSGFRDAEKSKPVVKTDSYHDKWSFCLPFKIRETEKYAGLAEPLTKYRVSLYVQGALGTGKTSKCVKSTLKELTHLPAIYTTLNTALVYDAARALDIPHYHQDDAASSNHLAVTANSLISSRFRPLVDQVVSQQGVLVIDEFAQFSDNLFGADSTLKPAEKDELLRLLQHMSRNGVQFLVLDGDITPVSYYLALLLGLNRQENFVKVTECDYPPPRVEIVTHEGPVAAHLVPQLNPEIKTVVATDSRSEAEYIYERCTGETGKYSKERVLVLHGNNKDEPKQAEFLRDTNEGALKYDLIIYSPCMTCGVSITKVKVQVFVLASSLTVGQRGIHQISRRFRAALATDGRPNTSKSNGVIHYLFEMDSNESLDTIKQVSPALIKVHIDELNSPLRTGEFITKVDNDIWRSAPVKVFETYMSGLGLEVHYLHLPLSKDKAKRAKLNRKNHKEEKKENFNEAVRTHPHVDTDEMNKEKSKSTADAKVMTRRFWLSDFYCFGKEALDENGHIPEEFFKFINRPKTKRAVLATQDHRAYRMGILNDLNEKAKSTEKRIRYATAKFFDEHIYSKLPPKTAGGWEINREDAYAIAYALPNIGADVDINPLPKDLDKSKSLQWLSAVLSGFGFERVERKQRRTKSGVSSAHVYIESPEIDVIVTRRLDKVGHTYIKRQIETTHKAIKRTFVDLMLDRETTPEVSHTPLSYKMARNYLSKRAVLQIGKRKETKPTGKVHGVEEVNIERINIFERAVTYRRKDGSVIVQSMSREDLFDNLESLWATRGVDFVKEFSDLYDVLRERTLDQRCDFFNQYLLGQKVHIAFIKDKAHATAQGIEPETSPTELRLVS